MAIWSNSRPKPSSPGSHPHSTPTETRSAPAGQASVAVPAVPNRGPTGTSRKDSTVATIGPSMVIKGEIGGGEELVIEGAFEGQLDLQDSVLTVCKGGKVNARISAKAVVVHGQVKGAIKATEHISIGAGAWVEADISAPRVAIDGQAFFRGGVTMQQPGSAGGEGGTPRTTAADKAGRS